MVVKIIKSVVIKRLVEAENAEIIAAKRLAEINFQHLARFDDDLTYFREMF